MKYKTIDKTLKLYSIIALEFRKKGNNKNENSSNFFSERK